MDELKTIRCDLIDADPSDNASREPFAPETCQELAATIDATRLIQPISVRRVGERFAVYIGFRRFTAVAVVLGQEEIACYVSDVSREEGLVLNVIENLQRQDLSYWEQCNGLREAFPEDTTMQAISVKISYSPSWVRLRWLFWELPKSIRDGVENGDYGPADIGIILQQPPEERIRAATRLSSGKAAGETLKDLQRGLTGRKNHRSKAEVQKMMTLCMESDHMEAVQALRYACGEISDTLLLELLDNLS